MSLRKETDWLTKLAMGIPGQNPDTIHSSKGDYEQRLDDGLRSIHALMTHVLDKKSIVTQDVLLNIIAARVADLIILRRMSK